MMSYENFVDYLKDAVRRYLPEKFNYSEVSITNVNKNNNLRLTGIIIKNPESNISPTIYLDGFYQEYKDGKFELEDCAKTVVEKWRDSLIKAEKGFNLNYLMSYEKIKDSIFPRLVSSENNEDYLKNTPYRIMDGLAVTYSIAVTEFDAGESKATVHVHNGLIERWGVTEEELYEVAVNNLMMNTEVRFQTMKEVMKEMFFMVNPADEVLADEIPDDGMYILTNQEKTFGAAMLLNHEIMDDITEKIGEFYILPSSIHETLLVRKDMGHTLEDLEQMVREVNETQVPQEEYLSDHVFLYDSKTKEIYRADHEEEHRRQNESNESNETKKEDNIVSITPHQRRKR